MYNFEVDRNDYFLVKGELHNPDYLFRTAEDICETTGVAFETINNVLNDPEVARQYVYTTKYGQPLFAPAKQPVKLRERVEQIRWILAH